MDKLRGGQRHAADLQGGADAERRADRRDGAERQGVAAPPVLAREGGDGVLGALDLLHVHEFPPLVCAAGP